MLLQIKILPWLLIANARRSSPSHTYVILDGFPTTPVPTPVPTTTTVTKCPSEFSLSDYTFSTSSVLGRDLTPRTEYFRRAAFTGEVLTNPSLTNPNHFYYIGTRIVSNTRSPAQNGGEPCPAEFPTTIYRRL
jgi:hypothetical protein